MLSQIPLSREAKGPNRKDMAIATIFAFEGESSRSWSLHSVEKDTSLLSFFFPSTGMLSADVFALAPTSFGTRALHFLMHRDGCECWAQEIGTVIDCAHHKRGKGACFASKNFRGKQRLTKPLFFLSSQEKATAKLTQS